MPSSVALSVQATLVALTDTQIEEAFPNASLLARDHRVLPSLRAAAKDALPVLRARTQPMEVKEEAPRKLRAEIDAFLLECARARPEGGQGTLGGALPVPDDTPWAPPRRKRKG